jgi:hypothetical protein
MHVRKILLATTLAAALVGASTSAVAAHPGGRLSPNEHSSKGHARKCAKPRKVGFVVAGTFVRGDATSVTLKVLRANRHARRSGLVTIGDEFTATPSDPARITYVNRSGPGDAEPTDKVRVVGKVTKLKHGCSTDGFTPTLSVRRVKVIGPDTDTEGPSS